MAAAQSSSKLLQLFKRGWIEIPEIMTGCAVSILALGFGVYSIHKYNQQIVQRPFKQFYVVLRDDDPKAEPYKKFHENPVY